MYLYNYIGLWREMRTVDLCYTEKSSHVHFGVKNNDNPDVCDILKSFGHNSFLLNKR